MLGNIYQYHLNDPAKAMERYQELMTDFPGSMFVVEARKRFRALRGDAVQ
jgi:outer membrane protein assembly factor BamD (BamD/ComL family)